MLVKVEGILGRDESVYEEKLVKVEGILGRDESVYEEKQVRYQTEQLITHWF